MGGETVGLPLYVIDLSGIKCGSNTTPDPPGRAFASLDDALGWLKENVGYDLCPEDDQVLVQEILPDATFSTVWHFSGWHWYTNDLPDQGAYLGDTKSVYEITMED